MRAKLIVVAIILVAIGVVGVVGSGQSLSMVNTIVDECAPGASSATSDICVRFNSGAPPTFTSVKWWLVGFVGVFSIMAVTGVLMFILTLIIGGGGAKKAAAKTA